MNIVGVVAELVYGSRLTEAPSSRRGDNDLIKKTVALGLIGSNPICIGLFIVRQSALNELNANEVD